ncbi:MAG: WbqC family protein [Salibacteraceae bacterium]
MNSTKIFPLLYAGPLSYYAYLLQNPGKIEAFENFSKQNFRSRCRVYGANGVITLSIPIVKETLKLAVTEVQISNIDAWQRNHWKSLVSAYKTSPFFEFYAHLIQPLFEKKYTSLWEFNLDFHQTILNCLIVEFTPSFTTEFAPLHENDLRILYSGKKPHPNSDQFNKYQQVFSYHGKFEPDLSILDGIFNLGPELESYLLKLPV